MTKRPVLWRASLWMLPFGLYHTSNEVSSNGNLKHPLGRAHFCLWSWVFPGATGVTPQRNATEPFYQRKRAHTHVCLQTAVFLLLLENKAQWQVFELEIRSVLPFGERNELDEWDGLPSSIVSCGTVSLFAHKQWNSSRITPAWHNHFSVEWCALDAMCYEAPHL